MAALIDTHCHLDPTYFPDGADAAIERARAVGVAAFVVVGVGADLTQARNAVRLASEHRAIAAAVGIHPHDATSWSEASHDELARLARDPSVVAVGEIGLDYHYDHSPRDVQKATFSVDRARSR